MPARIANVGIPVIVVDIIGAHGLGPLVVDTASGLEEENESRKNYYHTKWSWPRGANAVTPKSD